MSLFNYIYNIFNTKKKSRLRKRYLGNGYKGEQIACRFLKKCGYEIIDKNYRCRFGEIDIIAVENNVLCFIEVKSRKNTDYGLPEEYVDKRKQEKLITTSYLYTIAKKSNIADRRFDVVSVNLENLECSVIKNAFEVNL